MKQPKNEIKINSISLIALGAIDVSYELLPNEESSFGIYLFYKPNNDFRNSDINRTFSLSPYYRIYFSSGYNKGFFIESFAAYYTGKEYIYSDSNYYDSYDRTNATLERYHGLALGIGVGAKWITNRGFITEINFGLGRSFSGGPQDISLVARGGIIIGKRF